VVLPWCVSAIVVARRREGRGGCDPHEEREKTALGRTGDVRTQLTPVLCYYPVVCMLHQYCISASLSLSLLPVVWCGRELVSR
jgi:hypothetical protein